MTAFRLHGVAVLWEREQDEKTQRLRSIKQRGGTEKEKRAGGGGGDKQNGREHYL